MTKEQKPQTEENKIQKELHRRDIRDFGKQKPQPKYSYCDICEKSIRSNERAKTLKEVLKQTDIINLRGRATDVFRDWLREEIKKLLLPSVKLGAEGVQLADSTHHSKKLEVKK